ncbi:MAG: serine/threonine protein kinase, partial [Myxococcales bacterium]|nr:serine/threonine protein kinase [Myxococcales bacterium]
MTRSARPDGLEDTVAAITSLGEAAAIGRIEHALFGGDQRLVRLGRYEVIELIGAGAFGKVYRARDPQLARDVALKVLAVEHGRGADLLGEAQVMATVGHPNVAAIYDAGVVGDVVPPRVFFAMELVAGGNLRGWLATPRSGGEIVDVMRQAGRGIAAAHAAGIVHRDVKPENLLVGEDGRVRVVDFGLARALPAGAEASEG